MIDILFALTDAVVVHLYLTVVFFLRRITDGGEKSTHNPGSFVCPDTVQSLQQFFGWRLMPKFRRKIFLCTSNKWMSVINAHWSQFVLVLWKNNNFSLLKIDRPRIIWMICDIRRTTPNTHLKTMNGHTHVLFSLYSNNKYEYIAVVFVVDRRGPHRRTASLKHNTRLSLGHFWGTYSTPAIYFLTSNRSHWSRHEFSQRRGSFTVACLPPSAHMSGRGRQIQTNQSICILIVQMLTGRYLDTDGNLITKE